MSLGTITRHPTGVDAPRRPVPAALRLIILVALGLAAMSAVRLITGASTMTDSGTISAALELAVPIALPALGGLWSERAGVINIGLEGMMMIGAWCGAWAGWHTGSAWFGLLAGILAGALAGLLHGIVTVYFGVDHVISGVAINILAAGLVRFLSVLAYSGLENAGPTQSPPVPGFPVVGIPGLPDALAKVAAHRWFIISDLTGVLSGLTGHLSLLTVISVLLIPASLWALWTTPIGLRLRSCGEDPSAAESLGVKVYRYKLLATTVSGAFAGMGGVFLVTVASNIYREGQTAGRGFIGLAAMIFGNWRPGGLAAGAALFGYTDALQLRGSGPAVHALLLLVGAALVVIALIQLRRRNWTFAAGAVVAGAACLIWYAAAGEVPSQLVTYTPHIATLLVLGLAAQRLRPPAADGLRFRRGQGG